MRELGIASDCCIIDLQNGNTLKISETKTVIRAYHGFQKLSPADLISTYGNPPVLADFSIESHSPNYKLACSVYQYPAIIIFSKLV